MDALATREIEVESRYQMQNANFAVRNVYDAAIELITNADDRYCVLEVSGTIEIEVERKRKRQPDRFRVRDFADGMTSEDMDAKMYRPRVLGQWCDGIRFYAAASSPTRSRRT